MKLIDRFLELPGIYAAWQAPFAAQKFAPAARHLGDVPVGRVLDVGCGPGTNADHFKSADYVGLDINDDYLSKARARRPGRFIQADLASADLSSLGTFDVVLVNSFLHHVPDRAVDDILAEIHARLEPTGRVHILELVLPRQWSRSRIMARLDRGHYPRPLEQWEPNTSLPS